MAKIVIAEDNILFRQSLKEILSDFDIVGEASDGPSTVELVKTQKPDLLLLDLSMPKMGGIGVLHKIRPLYPDLKIIVLTIFDSEDYYSACADAGIDGYVLKDEGIGHLRASIKSVLAGRTYLSPGIDPR